jgi:hypothetical protein
LLKDDPRFKRIMNTLREKWEALLVPEEEKR